MSLTDPSPAYLATGQGRSPKRPSLLQQAAYRVDELPQQPTTQWQAIPLRTPARGLLVADFAVRPVWTMRPAGQVGAERLLLRRDGQQITYNLTNAPPDTPLDSLAQPKSQRYFVERSIQAAKSEFGWDEFQALKYRAWQHHLALTSLASWFSAETRRDWLLEHPPSPTLADHFAIDRLPELAVANVRELRRAALPLPQLSPQPAALLVGQHRTNRTRSRRSRLKNRAGP